METTSFFSTLLGLTPPYSISQISHQRDSQGQIVGVDVYISIAVGYLPSVESGVKVWRHDKTSRTWRHLNLFQYPCYLHCDVPKYKYKDKSKTYCKTLSVPWARKGSHFSLQFEQMVMGMLELVGCVSEVSGIVKEHPDKIWLLVDYYAPVTEVDLESSSNGKKESEEELALTPLADLRASIRVESKELSGVRKLDMDEKSRKKGHDYVTNIWDEDTRNLLGVELGKSSKTVESFVKKALVKGFSPHKIEQVNIDMSPAFIKVVRFYFPNADINFDKFHVSQLVSRAVDTFRKAKKRKSGEKLSKWLILKPVSQLNETEIEELEELLDKFPELAVVHAHKNIFSELWQMDNQEERNSFLAFWIDQIEDFGQRFKSKKLKSLAKTLNKHFEGISNAVKNKADNAFAEGMHSKMQIMKVKARGYKSFKRFLQMIKIHCVRKYAPST